ncbi:hypothetical protein CYY_009331 [Polysphondylium violaceum]|uniref:DUSP domain-containing protein n=1 Tax=Polysphondylium violaceum TaxID=133409 RepID=A0A8J4PNF2_9MYCE|nr:hypothetical protein CYY_009331 [Polysphondylium violaceum]
MSSIITSTWGLPLTNFKPATPTIDLSCHDVQSLCSFIDSVSLKEGDQWALINHHWYEHWREKLYSDAPINNFNLVMDDHLRPGISINRDFSIVPHFIWEILKLKYHGGPDLIFTVKRTEDLFSLELDYDIPFYLNCFKSSRRDTIIPVIAFNNETIDSFKRRACNSLKININKCKVWDYYHHSKFTKSPLKEDEVVSKSKFLQNQEIFFEEF